MPLVTTKQMLLDAQKGKYAIGAFNVENAEMVWAVCAAARDMGAPVILQTTSSTLKYLGPDYFAGLARAAIKEFQVTAAMHLDHGSSYELARACVQAGYTSVMIDGSKLPYEENISLSAQTAAYAHEKDCVVEAELGTVGGKEDETESSGNCYTDPAQAADFARRTGVDSLAIAFGTAHGFYKTPPVLDLDRISLVRRQTDVPLVMHGSSGIADRDICQAVLNGICKVNFATELRVAFTEGAREYLRLAPSAYDPKSYLREARERVRKLVAQRIGVVSIKAL